MILTLSKWPEDSQFEHYATDWKLSKNEDGSDVIAELNNTEDYKLVWKPDVIIPRGVKWYVTAVLHLRNKDDDSIEETRTIGPRPVFNDASIGKQALLPNIVIDEPYIKDINFIPFKSIKLVYSKPKCSTGYEKTLLVVEDVNKKIIYKGFHVLENSNNYSIILKNTDIDLVNNESLIFKTQHICKKSTASKVIKDIYFLTSVFYTIDGERYNLDPKFRHKIAIKPKGFANIRVINAKLLTRNSEVDCLIESNNIIVLPKILDYNSTYTIKAIINIEEANNPAIERVIEFTITTKHYDSEIETSRPYEFKNTLTKLNTIDSSSNLYNIGNKKINSEELFTYLIPLFNKNNNLAFMVFDLEHKHFSNYKELNINTDSTSIRLINNKQGYFLTKNDNNKTVVNIFSYNAFNDTITITNNIETDLENGVLEMNPVSIVSSYELIISGKENNNLVIKKLDLRTNELTKLIERNLGNDFTSTSISILNSAEAIIYIKSDKINRFYSFNLYDLNIKEENIFNDEFKNINLSLHKIGNNIIGIQHNTFEPLTFIIINKDGEITYKDTEYTDDKTTYAIIETKNNSIILILKNDNEIEIWEYR